MTRVVTQFYGFGDQTSDIPREAFFGFTDLSICALLGHKVKFKSQNNALTPVAKFRLDR